MKTLVFNLEAGVWWAYSLPHKLALRAAYEQERGNYNWWSYPPLRTYPFIRTRHGLTLGGFSVFTDRCPLEV